MAKAKKHNHTPAAKDALARFKYELADELVSHHLDRENYFSTTQSKPTLGDYMVEKMIQSQKDKISK